VGEREAGRLPTAPRPPDSSARTQDHEHRTDTGNARPGTLTIDTNVRKDADLKADFIASIKELGVLEPVIAHRKDDGTVHVLMGQRGPSEPSKPDGRVSP
jgi:hypothetical protein